MKKLIAVIPDKVDPSVMAAIMSVAVDFRLEHIQGELGEARPKRTTTHVPGTTTAATIMKHFSPSGTFLASQAMNWATEVGYASGSASGALSALAKAQYVRQISHAKYMFLKPFREGQLSVEAPANGVV